MRFSTVVALTVAAASSAPSFAFVAQLDGSPFPHAVNRFPLLESREPLSSEELTRRATEEILKRFDIAKYIHDHPQVVHPLSPINAIARDEPSDYVASFFDPNPAPHRSVPGTRILNAIEARDEDIAKRIIAPEPNSALAKYMKQFPGVIVAREDDIAKRMLASEITPAMTKWMTQHPNIMIARDDDMEKRMLLSELTPAQSKWIAKHSKFAIARDAGHELEARRRKHGLTRGSQ